MCFASLLALLTPFLSTIIEAHRSIVGVEVVAVVVVATFVDVAAWEKKEIKKRTSL